MKYIVYDDFSDGKAIKKVANRSHFLNGFVQMTILNTVAYDLSARQCKRIQAIVDMGYDVSQIEARKRGKGYEFFTW